MLAVMLVPCAMAALSGCDFADKFASFMPKGFRQPTHEPLPPEAEPDVKELIRANADTLFTARPGALAVAPPKRITGRGFSACVKAVVAGPMNSGCVAMRLPWLRQRGRDQLLEAVIAGLVPAIHPPW
jgi:hypothetical protein